MPSKSSAPARKSDQVSETREMSPFQKLVHRMSQEAELEKGEQKTGISDSQLSAILDSETEEEMWEADARGPLGGRDLADVEMQILGWTVKLSDDSDIQTPFRSGDRGMYLMIDAIRLSYDAGIKPEIHIGDLIQWNTSAPLLVAKLYWLRLHNKIPSAVVIRSTKLSAGKEVLKLQAASSHMLQGEVLADSETHSNSF